MSLTQSELNSGRVKIGDVKEVAKQEFLELLEKFDGSKALIWDSDLTGPMGLIAEYSVIKEHKVQNMFSLSSVNLPPATTEHVIFIIRPRLSNIDIVADFVKREENSGGSGIRTRFHIVFVPRESLLCKNRLIENGVFGSVTCHSLPVYLFPLDKDLLSMELPSAYRDIVEGDKTCLHYAATALTRLQASTGVIPRIYYKGASADNIYDLMVRMKREACGNEPQVKSQIDTLVMIDRAVDLISPLPTQLTYEGLIDEMFGINCSSVTITEPDRKVLPLNSREELYKELRGLNFNAVGPALSRKTRSIQAIADERLTAQTVSQLKQFTSKLPGIDLAKQSVATHTGLAEMVKKKTDSEEFLIVLELEQRILTGSGESGKYLEEIEDLVCSNTVPLNRIIRVICLQSVVCGGLKQKVFESYRKLILESHGYDLLLTLENLSEAGLLVSTATNRRSQYSVLSKRLGIILENVDEQNPHDIAYVHTVYGPLSVKLVQKLEQPGWRNIRDVLDTLPGPHKEDTQQVSAGLSGRRGFGDKKVVLVFYVGGVTMAEIAALRFLSQQEESNVEYIIATTSVITGNTFVKSLYTKLEAPMYKIF